MHITPDFWYGYVSALMSVVVLYGVVTRMGKRG